jgi:predicted deacylase
MAEQASEPNPESPSPFELGGSTVAPGQRRQIDLPVGRLATRTMLSMPVTVVHGAAPGPRLWLSAAIHGDELNGVEIVRRVLEKLDPQMLAGSLVAVPIVNVFGFIHQSRYLPDRRDLNRSFPGSPRGSLAARLAHIFMSEVVSRCTHGVDLHTASHDRSNHPQIRADLDDLETRRCAHAFAAPLTIHARTRDASLRDAAAARGVPVLLYEAGEAMRFDRLAIATGVAGVLRLMEALGMVASGSAESAGPSLEIRESRWIRAARGGIARTELELGQRIRSGDSVAVISDAFGDSSYRIKAPADGIVIGINNNPLVNRGDALVHIGAVSAPPEPAAAGGA